MVGDWRGHNLPLSPTPLIGREHEVASGAPDAALGGCTAAYMLTGPAGTGKTRLGVAVGAALAGEFAHGAWFVDLAPVSDPTLVVPAIAQTLGVRDSGDVPLAESVNYFLREKHILLVLDNFEQVLAGAPQVAELLGACPGLVILATSLAVLHLRWEYELAVPTLAVPNLRRLPLRRMHLPATRSGGPFHRAGPGGAPPLRPRRYECAGRGRGRVRLDGLPLALELAVPARIRALPPRGAAGAVQAPSPIPGWWGARPPDTPPDAPCG